MRLTTQVEEARKLLEDAISRLDDQDAKIQALPDDTDPSEVEFQRALFNKFDEDVTRRRETVERLIAIQRARELIPPADDDDPATDPITKQARQQIRIGQEPLTYRADVRHSFFRDMYFSQKGDKEAQARLDKHNQETRALIEKAKRETRDVSTADPGAGVFVPPVYLGELLAELPREGRPFADIVPKMPLTASGMSVTVPRVTTGTATGVQVAEADPATETDIDGTLLTVPVRTIAGQNDVSVQALERTEPGLDFIIFQDLRADYDEQLDTQLLQGTGANGQHMGIRAVTGTNTVTFTHANPTGALLLPKIYDGIQQIATNRHRAAQAIIMHPRRAAWLASSLSLTFPLFQLGVLNQAAGSQQAGFVDNFAGLMTVQDANINTERGASTDEDEIYVVRQSDMFLMEGELQTRVFDQVLSGTLQVRLQVRAYSAFISGRYPTSITEITGTGLKAPTF